MGNGNFVGNECGGLRWSLWRMATMGECSLTLDSSDHPYVVFSTNYTCGTMAEQIRLLGWQKLFLVVRRGPQRRLSRALRVQRNCIL